MKTIGVYINHPRVRAWNFREGQKLGLAKLIPSARILICTNRAEFESILPKIEIGLVWYFREEWFARALHLEWLVTPAAGRDFLGAQPPPGIEVHNCHFHGQIMAETVAAMVLAHCRGILKAYSFKQSLSWPQAELEPYLTTLRGGRVTILGFGAIGRWIAGLLKPFGVIITGIKRKPAPAPSFFSGGDRIVTTPELDAVLPSTDHLILALPADTGTDNLINAQRLKLLPPQAALYNVGRGNAVDENALCLALKRGTLSAAYLDVFKEEPLPSDSPLLNCPNCFLLPHVSAVAPNYLDLFIEEVAREFKKRYPEE
jgi:phosphoglycerate dehydrogenase-like enzyme